MPDWAAGWAQSWPFIADPWFYALAVPAVLLMGLGKSGFLSGFGALATPLMAVVLGLGPLAMACAWWRPNSCKSPPNWLKRIMPFTKANPFMMV